MKAKGIISEISHNRYEHLRNLHGLGSHQVIGETARGVGFWFTTSSPDSLAVGQEIEVDGDGVAERGLRTFFLVTGVKVLR